MANDGISIHVETIFVSGANLGFIDIRLCAGINKYM
jgi:hypothetical protein